jgi:hypothetical protein
MGVRCQVKRSKARLEFFPALPEQAARVLGSWLGALCQRQIYVSARLQQRFHQFWRRFQFLR